MKLGNAFKTALVSLAFILLCQGMSWANLPVLFFDDFTGTALDTSRWSIFVDSNGEYNWPYVAGGLLHSQGYHTRIDSIPTFAPTGQSVIARARIRLGGDYHQFGFGVGEGERAGPITDYYFDTYNRFDWSMGREDYVHALARFQPAVGSFVTLLDVEIPVTWYEFHEFAIERTPSEVIYSIDGQEVARVADAFGGALPVCVWNARWDLMLTDWVEVSQVSEPEWSFVQISDTHIGWTERKCELVPGAFPPKYKYPCRLVDARENLAAVIYKVMKDVKPAFIVNTGDVADFGCAVSPFVGESCSQGYWDYSQAIAEATDNGIRVYSIPGNHDQRYPWPYQAVCQTFPACFRDPFGNPNSWFMLGGSTFTNDDNILFVVLNTGNGNCSGALTTEDIDFLNGLDKDVPKIILTHHPAMALESDRLGISKLCPDIWQDVHIDEYQEELLYYCEDKSNNVCAVLSGHTHVSNSRAWFVDKYIECLGWWENGTWHHWYPLYVQTGTAGKTDLIKGKYPVFRRIDVIGGEVKINDVTEVTKEDYYDYIAAKIYSPANLHVYDSNGEHTGYEPVNGFERGILGSVYFSHYEVEDENGVSVLPEEVLIFDPCDDYLYEVVGTERGTYRLEVIFGQDGNDIVFEANGIPTLPGAVHDYLIDWDLLAQGSNGVTLLVDADGDGTFERTITSDSNLTAAEFDAPMTVTVLMPGSGDAVQDGITLAADASDEDGVIGVYFAIREPNSGSGVPIGKEDLAGMFNSATGKWECSFNTTQLPDGYYVVLAKGVDTYGNVGWSQVVPFSIRNWAVIKLLPATPSNKAGRTMPVKFSIRIAQSVDPAMPFVYNEDLEIRIYKSTNPSVILQRSLFGQGATNYRIDVAGEKYITNFKTLPTPATYVVEIWRPEKNFKVGSFTFKTVK